MLICTIQGHGSPQKSNPIIVVTNESAREHFALLQAALLSRKYTIRITNSDSLTVHTGEKQGDSYTGSHSISGQAKEKEIDFSGTYCCQVDAFISGTSRRVFVYAIAHRGKRGSLPQQTFAAMQVLAGEKGGGCFMKSRSPGRGPSFKASFVFSLPTFCQLRYRYAKVPYGVPRSDGCITWHVLVAPGFP